MKEINKNLRDLFGSEAEYVARLGKCFIDPEEKKAFWETIREKKKANPAYSIYTDFPPVNGTDAGLKICGEILEMLRGRSINKEP